VSDGDDAELFVEFFARKMAKINRERQITSAYLGDFARHALIVSVKPLEGVKNWRRPRPFLFSDGTLDPASDEDYARRFLVNFPELVPGDGDPPGILPGLLRMHPPQSADWLKSADLLTGPLTISAVLKGTEWEMINDAYPTGDPGVHFRFSLFNENPFDFLVHEVHVDVLAYAPLNLDHLVHGVGATDVERSFRVKIRPELGSYRANYFGSGRQGEYVTIPPSKSEKFDVEIVAPKEGIYDICVRFLGGSAGARVDVRLDSTIRRVAFFDATGGYMVDRGLGGRMLTYQEYSAEMKSWEKDGY
jgi:hypothetical protein